MLSMIMMSKKKSNISDPKKGMSVFSVKIGNTCKDSHSIVSN